MTKVYNTFGFTPKFRAEANVELVDSDVKTPIRITDNEVTSGSGTIQHIKSNADKMFLVNKTVYDYLVELGFRNVCMFDPAKTEYVDGRASTYGGLLFP